VATTVKIEDIVFDESIYPRSRLDDATVDRYAESMQDGVTFPPIVLESNTFRLLDGWHRAEAGKQIGLEELSVDWHTVPDGMDVRLYAASLSAKHGLTIPSHDLKDLTRELYEQDEQLDITEVARLLGRARETIRDWVRDIAEDRQAIEERKRAARNVAINLLRELGWSWQRIGELFSIGETTARSAGGTASAAEDLDPAALKAAIELVPEEVKSDIEAIADKWREERIFASWSDEERELLKRIRSGETIVVNLKAHSGFISWASAEGLYTKIDRATDWGNPFKLPDDGDRDTVIKNYAKYYLPHKPSLLTQIEGLNGKALGCWCAPKPCHGNVLVDVVNGHGEYALAEIFTAFRKLEETEKI
jgi:hypothetical protein